MSANFGQTAVLIFTRTASAEAAHKTFVQHAGKKGNRAIAAQLIRRSIATGKHTKLPVIIHDSDAQHSQTFGENLADALEAVFESGYAQVMVLGNDSPELRATTLLETNQQLVNHPIVLGPAADGGVYLIGLQQSAYQRQAFLELPWETAELKDAFEQYLPEYAIHWLEPLHDVDHEVDFKSFLARLSKSNPLNILFQSILASRLHGPVFVHRPALSVVLLGASLLRGPPA